MRVVIAEDSVLLREGLVALLREHEVEVVAQAEDADGLLRIVGAHKPDLAIVDVRLPPSFTDEGIRAAVEARRRHPGLGVLILSQYVEPVYTAELLAGGEGGVGYLLKERVGDIPAFLDAIRRVAAGGTALDREVVAELVGERRAAPESPLDSLSPREREVLSLMGRGPHQQRDRRGARCHPRRGREARLQHLRQVEPPGCRRRPPPRPRRARLPARRRRRLGGSVRGTRS
jgi:DNA-binding NarL/FixJ family response regulator